jgi:hypothetical protein
MDPLGSGGDRGSRQQKHEDDPVRRSPGSGAVTLISNSIAGQHSISMSRDRVLAVRARAASVCLGKKNNAPRHHQEAIDKKSARKQKSKRGPPPPLSICPPKSLFSFFFFACAPPFLLFVPNLLFSTPSLGFLFFSRLVHADSTISTFTHTKSTVLCLFLCFSVSCHCTGMSGHPTT